MSCYICGAPIERMALDPRDMKTKPCGTCENVIAEMVNEDDDDMEETFFEDEELGEEDIDVEEN